MNSRKATKSSDWQPTKIRLPEGGVLIGKQHRRWIFDEDSFIELILERGLRKQDVANEYGVPMHVVDASIAYYRPRYAREIRMVQAANYGRAARRRPPRAKRPPRVLLDEALLRLRAAEGRKIVVMAQEFATSEWYVQQNLEWYGIDLSPEMPYRLQHVDSAFIDKLETLAPGFRAAALKFYEDPQTYYEYLYLVLAEAVEFVHFIKEQGKGHGAYLQYGKIGRSHICWNLNRHELRLSLALLQAGIQHHRQVTFTGQGGFLFDFWLVGSDIFIEIDGSFHVKDAVTRARDVQKDALAKSHDVRLLRVTTADIDTDLEGVLRCIRASLQAR